MTAGKLDFPYLERSSPESKNIPNFILILKGILIFTYIVLDPVHKYIMHEFFFLIYCLLNHFFDNSSFFCTNKTIYYH